MTQEIYQRTGSCSQCGQCCTVNFGIARFLFNLAKTHCKYLVQDSGKYICEITAGKIFDSEDKTFTQLIPLEDIEYWKRECQPYPNPNDSGHCPPQHKLPINCTYKMVGGG